jgi:hypothetical protein
MNQTPARRLGFYNTDAAAEHYLGIRWPRAIWQAVLEQAINDAVEGMSAYELEGLSLEAAKQLDDQVRLAAQEWIQDDANEPRRFVWVCEQLDLEPSAVRAVVERRRRGD